MLANMKMEATELCWSRDLIVPGESPKLTFLPNCMSGCLITCHERNLLMSGHLMSMKNKWEKKIPIENAFFPTGCLDSKK